MNEYDVVVVGAGPGGYVCAIRASQNGLKTAIVDKQWLGGVCLNVGCIPSKALLKNAELAHTLRERAAEFGISFDNLKLDYGEAVKRSRQVSDPPDRGVAFLMKKNAIDVYMGTAKLASASQVDVTDAEGATAIAERQEYRHRHRCELLHASRLEPGREKGAFLSGSHPAGNPAAIRWSSSARAPLAWNSPPSGAPTAPR